MSNQWLAGAGLLCDIARAILLFLFGVPRHPALAQAGKGFLELEEEFPDEKAAVERAARLGNVGIALLIVGFALQFASLF